VSRHEKTIKVTGKKIQWEDDSAIAVTDELFSAVKQISVKGLKKGDQLTVEIPDFTFLGPDFIIPFWAGIPSFEQAQKMVRRGAPVP
jgi:hypothetical protein